MIAIMLTILGVALFIGVVCALFGLVIDITMKLCELNNILGIAFMLIGGSSILAGLACLTEYLT